MVVEFLGGLLACACFYSFMRVAGIFERRHWEASEAFQIWAYANDTVMDVVGLSAGAILLIAVVEWGRNFSEGTLGAAAVLLAYVVLIAGAMLFALCRADVPPAQRQTKVVMAGA